MARADFKTVGILGAGTIGSGLASFYARCGMHVKIFDSDPETLSSAPARATANLEDMARYGLIAEQGLETARRAFEPVSTIEDVASGVDLIHESVLERYEVKAEVLASASSIAPPATVIASSSSGLLMTKMQEAITHPERSLIAHPFNPPHLVPLVELVPGKQTAPGTIAAMYSFYESAGKIPVTLKKEVPGHLANRLAAALWREAIDLVASGVASVEDVDKALYAGPGIRWAFMGQHLIYHLGGGPGGYEYFIEHVGTAFSKYWQTMSTWTEIPEEARKTVIDGIEESIRGKTLSELQAWRDEKMAKLLKVIYE